MKAREKGERLPFPRVVEPIGYDYLEAYFSKWCADRQLTIREAEAILWFLKDSLRGQRCGGMRPSTINGKPISEVKTVEHHDNSAGTTWEQLDRQGLRWSDIGSVVKVDGLTEFTQCIENTMDSVTRLKEAANKINVVAGSSQ